MSENGDRPSSFPAGLPGTRREFPTLSDLPEHPDATELARAYWAMASAYQQVAMSMDERLRRIERAMGIEQTDEH